MTNTVEKNQDTTQPMDVNEYTTEFQKSGYLATSPYTSVTYKVEPKLDGYSFYQITPSVGKLPDHLEGKYSSPKIALSQLELYLASKKPKTKIKKRVLKNASADEPDNSEQLREGVDNGVLGS